MNLEFTSEEEALIAEVGRVFDGLLPVTRLRSREAPSSWRALVDAGWADLGAGIESGDLEVSIACAISRAAGQHLLIEQFISSSMMLSALIAHGPPADRELLADRISRRPGVLWGDGRRLEMPVDPKGGVALCFGVEEDVDLYRITTDGSGRLRLGIAATDLPARVRKVAGLSVGVGYVETAQSSWHDVPLDLDKPALTRIGYSAILLHSAALLGAAQAALELTRGYVLNRVQFGVPIGSFQAVKHGLADVLVANEVAWNALLCASADGAFDVESLLTARVLSVEAAIGSARACAQFHGGIGFTWESDVHWYLKVILDGSQRFGAVDDVAAELGRMRIGVMAEC